MERSKHKPLPSNLRLKARQLRKSATPAEKLLWEMLRNNQLDGHKFRRQHPIPERGQFVLDFFCHKAKLAIELDGGYHDSPNQQELDQARTNTLHELGISVLRFRNEEVERQPEKVLQEILEAVESMPSP